MYLFYVTINIDEDIEEQWLHWMYERCTLLVSGISASYKVLKPVNAEQFGGNTYSFQFILDEKISAQHFEEQYNELIGKLMYKNFKDKFAEFRTLLEIIKD
ncbi:MAG: DUF4286 family protein [Cytophagaceae bacterium]|nr:DUF4286 family protein [Cytophagaceae bacterium]MDW8456157.1 DUF4286 family protein [Cytophagaceae bacterium]